MQTLRQLTDTTWVLPGATNIGFLVEDNRALLVDSGNDGEAGRRIRKLLDQMGWNLEGIINTHSNADHIGGNDYLQRRYDCSVYSSRIENYFIETPRLEPSLLWGGFPVPELRSKFFEARPSHPAAPISREHHPFPDRFSVLELPGHYLEMIGLLAHDGVAFLGDAVFSAEILGKYAVPFIYDVAGFKATLEMLREVPADYYVPSHGDIQNDIGPLADANLAAVEALERGILEALEEARSFEELLRLVCTEFSVRLNCAQYALVGSTIKSFLSYLLISGRAEYFFDDNRMLWRRIG